MSNDSPSTPQTFAEGFSETGKVFPNLAEYVHHRGFCGGGDHLCACGAVAALDDLERAYALLWATNTTERRVHEARRLLFRLIGKDGQRRAIGALPDKDKPVAPNLAQVLSAGDAYP